MDSEINFFKCYKQEKHKTIKSKANYLKVRSDHKKKTQRRWCKKIIFKLKSGQKNTKKKS